MVMCRLGFVSRFEPLNLIEFQFGLGEAVHAQLVNKYKTQGNIHSMRVDMGNYESK